jgi:nucleoid-associated protein YgaU
MVTGSFSSTEWKQLVNAPQLIYHLLTKQDRAGIFTRRSESKALDEYLSSHRPQSELVQSIIAAQNEAEKIDASPEETKRMLGQVGTLLEAKASGVEGDAAREFLMGAAQAIAQASREESVLRDKPVSDDEKATLAEIEHALKATDADKRRRRDAIRAEEEQFKAERQAEAQKKVAEVRERRDAEAREKREAEARERTEEARKKREAEARERMEEARQKREAEARARREADAQKAAEEKTRAEAEAMKREAEALKAEAEQLKREAEATKREAEAAAAAPKAAPPAADKIYVVKSGDTLSGIALEVYGNAGRWREIFEANRDVIDKPNLIRPGWKLRIPD